MILKNLTKIMKEAKSRVSEAKQFYTTTSMCYF